MAITYKPSVWVGSHYQDFFAESLYANATVGKNLVRFIPGIKTEIQLTTTQGAPVVQPYALTPTTPQGSLNWVDRTLKPSKSMIHDRFDPNQMLATQFSEDMAAGATNLTSARQMKITSEYLVPRVSKLIEKAFWQQVYDELTGSTTNIDRTGAVLSVATILDEIKAVYAAIPGEVLATGEQMMYLPEPAKQLVLIANNDRQFRDLLSVSADGSIKYLDCPLAFVPLPANTIIAGNSREFVWGTDLLSDEGKMEINKVSNESDEMFYKIVFTLGAAVQVHSQKVLSKV
jgi:hypothetical protein